MQVQNINFFIRAGARVVNFLALMVNFHVMNLTLELDTENSANPIWRITEAIIRFPFISALQHEQ